MADKVTPNEAARVLSKATGRAVTPKMVRTIARATIKRFDKVAHPAYQSHEYTAAEIKTIRTVLMARGSRTASAATVKVSARKPRTAKVAPVAMVAS